MARVRTYRLVSAPPNGRSFYTPPQKHVRKARAPITPALKAVLAKQREARQEEYGVTLQNIRDAVEQHAVQLRERFGGHSTEYYLQEILQHGRLEHARWKTSRWNVYVKQELRLRNEGMCAGIVPAPPNE